MAYVLWLDELHCRASADIQAALIARAMGSEVEIPDLSMLRNRFDEMLRAEPVEVGEPTQREQVLKEAFGLSGG